MKLEEAIEIMTEERKDHHSFSTDIIGQAEQLLIEAGKRILDTSLTYDGQRIDLLPGETKD